MEINKRKRSISPTVKSLVTETKKIKHSESKFELQYSSYTQELGRRRARQDTRVSHESTNRIEDWKKRRIEGKRGRGRGRGIRWKSEMKSWTGRGRQSEIGRWTETEGRRGIERENAIGVIRNDAVPPETSDAAITCGIDSTELTSKLQGNVNEKKIETIYFLYEICKSPNRHCVRSVFTTLRKNNFFGREDVLILLEQILSDQVTDEFDYTVLMTGHIIKSYCFFLGSIGHADEVSQHFLNRFEALVGISHNSHPCSLDDFGHLRSPADCDLGLVLKPDISALYCNPRLEGRQITDSFENSRSLLERVYYLYREDITRPLVRGLRRLKYHLKKSTDLEKFRDEDIRVYRDVQIITSIASQSHGLIWDMQLDTTQPLVKTIMNKHRKLLQRGNLICISNDVFKRNIVYGTIVESDKEDDLTRNGIVRVEFQQSFTINQGNRGQLFTLVETKSNCLAYIDALIALQVQLHENENLPFEQQIVYHQQNFNPPHYLTCVHDDKRRISFECLQNKSDIREESIEAKIPKDDTGIVKDILEGMLSTICADRLNVPVLETEKWPTPDDVGMDISQYRAFCDGLTQGLSLIQGPPGTGKTVMALKIIEIMLNNENIWSKENVGPIILLSYTNHALDQFLEGITRMPIMKSAQTTDIVRVGSRCKTESLDKYNLAHRRKENKTKTRQRALSKLHMTAKDHTELSEAVRTYLTSLVHEEFLRQANVIPDHLFRSLRKPYISQIPSDETYLCKWLSIFLDDFVPQKRNNEEYFDTNEEIESDENASNDRFGLGNDNEDFEFEPRLIQKPHCSELLKHPRLIVTAETEEDRHKRSIERKTKPVILQEVKRRIMRTKPMSETDESHIADVWDLPDDDRWRLYKLWIHKIITVLKDDMVSVQRRYKSAYRRYKEYRHSEDIKIFKKARIVAMTTSRAAFDHGILRRSNARIMVIEEAAEVPDHHILASLVPSIQHLVMIGDHQQLRPGYNDFRTAMRYGLNVSMFERLITTGRRFQQLQFQHRMRPEIADLLTPSIYSELLNHASVMEIANVHGIQNNVFFLNHSESEHASAHKDMKSHKNQHEVEFIAQLYRYLRLQGYGSGDITVLTTYKEQERLLRRAIRTIEENERFASSEQKISFCDLSSQQTGSDKNQTVQNHFSKYNMLKDAMQSKNFETFKEAVPGACVTTVDNFQGEENKIVLLSLVRSNSKGKIGFLKEPNRICVALSRAKAGLYVIGDCNLLRMNNCLWEQILQKAEANGCVGSSLTLYCKNHHLTTTNVSKAVDFQKVPDGGCGQKCSAMLVCGHECPRRCHADDPNHELRPCNSICGKPCSFGHKCKNLCSKCRAESGKCLPCKVKVFKTLPNCRHTVPVPCSKKLDECICNEHCRKILECGHQCQRRCGRTCNNSENCNELVKATADCGHVIQTACHSKEDPSCSVKCMTKLTCGHLCKGTCRSCFSGHLHQQCREKIAIKLKCGHTITIDCNLEYCEQTYGGHLKTCQKECKWQCKHLACAKTCGEPCTRLPCNARCTKRLKCHHLCDLLLCDHNGDHWCRKCSMDIINGGLWRTDLNVKHPHYIRLQRCRCIFQTEVLDENLIHQKETSLDTPRCPNCDKDIIDMRYYNVIKRTSQLMISSRKCHYKDYIKLQSSLHDMLSFLEDIAERFIPDISLQVKYIKVSDRMTDRLKSARYAFSVQESRDLSLIVPKMTMSLKKCIEQSKQNPESMSEELSSRLEECENQCSSIFSYFKEDIKNLQYDPNEELDKFAQMTSKESTLMMILPSF